MPGCAEFKLPGFSEDERKKLVVKVCDYEMRDAVLRDHAGGLSWKGIF